MINLKKITEENFIEAFNLKLEKDHIVASRFAPK